MLGKKIINTGGVACTTDTTQILDGGTTQSTALYRFEDNANDTASGTGKFNKGGIFNGSSSKIALPAILPTSSTADSSVSFWFKYSGGQSGTGTLFSSYGGNSAQPGYHLGLEAAYTYGGVSYPDGSLYLTGYSMGTGSGVNGTTSYTDGQWHHVVVTYDFSTGVLSCFVDNASSATLSISFTSRPSSIGPFSQSGDIGYQLLAGPHRYAKCSIDQFRIFNKDLSTSERTTLYNETTTTANTLQVLGDTSCVAAYTFEGNANDLNTSTPKNGTASNVTYDYNGTASNITYATGKFDKAAVFNGSDSYINTNIPASVFNNYTWSVSMWLKHSDTDFTYFAGTSTGNTILNGMIFGIYGDGSRFDFIWRNHIGTSVSRFQGGSLAINTWTNIVVTSNNNSIHFYQDGLLMTAYSSSHNQNPLSATSITHSQPFNIGRAGTKTTELLDGMIDQVRVFDKALSPGEVNSLYNETTTTAALGTISNPSTIAYYKMADATDETGSYNGVASNVDFNVQGKYGFAGKFNGSSSRIEVPNASKPSLSTATVSFWLKTSSTNTQGLVGEGYSGNHWGNLVIYLASNKLNARSGNASSAEDAAWASTSNVNTGAWVHCAVTISGNTSQIFINGTLETTKTLTVTRAATINPFTIGQIYANGNLFGGWTNDCEIDQVRIFNKVISAAEVTKLYNEIQCADTITTPESYFNSVLYTGNNTSRSITTTFQPDFVWLKSRGSARDHRLFDSIRGATKGLYSNLSNAEFTESSLTAFNTNGFTLGTAGNQNVSSENYVSWAWKAASSNTTNNDGTIASTVRASQESGFSIVTYSPNDTVGMSIGHGLGKAPSLVITKRLDTSQDWGVYNNVSTGTYATNWLSLNDTDAYGSGNFMNIKSSTLELPATGAFWGNGGNQVAYCFANVDGYQRIGSYVGNGSANGPFVYTGFEPAFLLIKGVSTNNHSGWSILDNKRGTLSGTKHRIEAQDPAAESTNYADIPFYTNGFKINTTNQNYNTSGETYIFLAIAANPDTTAPTKANSFNTKTFASNNGTQSITGLGFQPDFVWTKSRTNAYNHSLYDSIRGVNKLIQANTTNAQSSLSNAFNSFDSDGFTLGSSDNSNSGSGNSVAWAWKALDHDRNLATINNDGNTPSIVSANPEAGFSIVKYVGTGNFIQYGIGHGLNAAPQAVIQKRLTGAVSNWYFITTILDGSTDYLKLNSTDAKADVSGTYANFTLGAKSFSDWWNSGEEIINYCFHSVAGYSSIASYTGATGNKVINTGFRPSFVMIKNTSNAGNNWNIMDSARDTSNPIEFNLWADTNDTESTASQSNVYDVDFDDNGFTIKNNYSPFNGNGQTYLYMAFK